LNKKYEHFFNYYIRTNVNIYDVRSDSMNIIKISPIFGVNNLVT